MFFAADAVRSDRTVAFHPDNRFEERQFARLRAGGAIHEDQPGRYWLDLPAYDRLLRERFDRVRIMLIVVLLAVAAIALFGSASGHLR